ncbi:hypothetical protein NDU88_000362 [Pleurodeles waltl]|uniref:Uncharacterized protein n=1 Tax=Pleurodeles waltl TaxID=8319 RepID=A0AAV7VWA0_PLEWA|nr:hypothetical protein NDU88_000362 [Pleurodeles waltl]
MSVTAVAARAEVFDPSPDLYAAQFGDGGVGDGGVPGTSADFDGVLGEADWERNYEDEEQKEGKFESRRMALEWART